MRLSNNAFLLFLKEHWVAFLFILFLMLFVRGPEYPGFYYEWW